MQQHDPHSFDAFDPHEVDHGTMYYKMHWGAWKGHVRGIIRGLVVGCGIGAMIGAGFAALVGLGAVALPIALSLPVMVAGFAAFGGIMATGLMGRIGNAAGNVSAQLAEIELRERYPELPEISPDSPEPGYGHHYEIPADRDRGKFFHSRVGVMGSMLGAGFGGLLSVAGGGFLSNLSLHIPELFTYAAHGADIALSGGLLSSLPIAMGALYGLSFGINRSHFKSIFNFTDNLLQGKVGGPDEAQLAKDRERYRLMGEDGPPSVLTSLQRQEEYYRLYEGYYKQAFTAGFGGNARGLVGGLVAGGLTGVLLGGLAAGGIVALGIGGAVVAPALAVATFIGVTATAMKMASLHFFTEAAFEAAGHSHVHEIHHERMRAMRKGINLSFEEAEIAVDRRRQADPELTPPTAQPKTWFKPKVALVMGALGVLAGFGLAPLATGVAGLLGMGTHLSATAAAAVFGLTGASFGLGKKVTGALHDMGDTIFHGSFHPGDQHPDIKTQGNIPLMSPRSELAEYFGRHLEKEQAMHYQPDYAVAPHAASAVLNHQDPAPVSSVRDIVERGARSLTQQVESPAPAEGLQR